MYCTATSLSVNVFLLLPFNSRFSMTPPQKKKDPKMDTDYTITFLKMALKLTHFVLVIHNSVIISKIKKYLLSKNSPRNKQGTTIESGHKN